MFQNYSIGKRVATRLDEMKEIAESGIKAVKDIICDVCGESVVPDFQKNHRDALSNFKEFGILRGEFGYGSNHDGEHFSADLCSKCFFKLVEQVETMKAAHRKRKN